MSRASVQAGHSTRIGEKIDWEDGLLEVEAGVFVRQIVLEDTLWSSSTWISERGEAYQRVYNSFEEMWMWRGPKNPTVDPRSGRMNLVVGCTHQRHTLSLQRAIATAWIELPLSMHGKENAFQVFEGPLCADTVGWVIAGSGRSVGGVGKANPYPEMEERRGGEEWRPLRYVWYSLSGQPVQSYEGEDYDVSRSGWFRSNLTGRRTKGHLSFCGRRWVSVAEEGFVWIDEAVLFTFSPSVPSFKRSVLHLSSPLSNAFATLKWGKKTRSVGHMLRDSILSGASLTDLRDEYGFSLGTIWSKLLCCAQTEEDETYLYRIVPTQLRDACVSELRGGGGLVGLQARCRSMPALKSLSKEDSFQVCKLCIELCVRDQFRRRWEARLSNLSFFM